VQPGPSDRASATTSAEDPWDPGPPTEAALGLARELGLSLTVADVLDRRGFGPDGRTQRYLEPRLADLTSPHDMADRQAAAERILRAIDEGERIAIFGDYDCDGLTSVAILTEVIEKLGGEVTPLMANRFDGGYGLSEPALRRVQQTEARLLVTCDCGSSDHARLAEAREAGIDAVVVDHHQVPDEPLPAVAFLNPHQPACRFPFKGLASCGLALLLAAALRKGRERLDLRPWLDLVAIGTVADVAPLEDDNRALVRAGLEVLARGGRPGLESLVNRAVRGRRRPVTAELVAFQIAPRLNALGRLGDPTAALRLLLVREAAEAGPLLEAVEQATVERRRLQQAIEAEAIATIAAQGYQDDPALVLAKSGWHPGVVGIVAGRLASRYQKPTALVALDGEAGRGSVRGPEGMPLYDLLSACADRLLGFGGHQAAAGLQIQSDEVDDFRGAWLKACAAAQPAADRMAASVHRAEVRLDERDDWLQVVDDLQRLEPCGEANPAPRLLLGKVRVRRAREIKGHLKLELERDGQSLSGFLPDGGRHAAELDGGRVDLVGLLRRDHWRGGDALEVLVTDWRRARGEG